MRFGTEDLVVGRVLSEDDRSILVEIMKDDDTPMTLDPEVPDRFFTMAFIKFGRAGARLWKPWEEEDA